jgi:hypothetical protein
MEQSTAQRRLVKSPPELWAEISDVTMLARRLGEFGEIRITRIDAETTVAWEGDRACGTVELQPSGWGTKVTITAKAVESAEPPVEEAVAEDVEVVEEAEVVSETAGVVEEPTEAEADELLEAVVVADATDAAETDVVETDGEEAPAGAEEAAIPVATPAPKRGFFARLFRRGGAAARVAEPVAETAEAQDLGSVTEVDEVSAPAVEAEVAVEAVTEAAPVVEAAPAPVVEAEAPLAVASDAEPAPTAVVEPEPAAAPPLDEGAIEAILVGALDDLGAAHHRPFSRG